MMTLTLRQLDRRRQAGFAFGAGSRDAWPQNLIGAATGGLTP